MNEETKQAAEAFSRYQNLVKKLQNPKSKRDILDVLEYQHMREKQADYSRILLESMANNQKKNDEQKEAEKKEELK